MTAIFPPRSHYVRDIAGHTFSNREVYLISDLLRFVSDIDAGRDDGYAYLIEFRLMFCEAD